MLSYSDCYSEFEKSLKGVNLSRKPGKLYEPIEYILSIGGKRIRPCLTMMAHSMYADDIRSSLPAALAIEVFHNFTLLHDDIMDQARTRRNQETVHIKWDTNTAILSGDAMMILSYELLQNLDPTVFAEVISVFNKTALEVCEGQQYDMDFEKQHLVSVEDYLEMIRLKTAVLLAASLSIGGITARAPKKDVEALYDFGQYLGIAFQLQDDYLDTFSREKDFGKSIGGDIASNKKTFLLISALNSNNKEAVQELKKWIDISSSDPTEKIEVVRKIYVQLGVDKKSMELSGQYFEKANQALERISIPENKKSGLKELVDVLIKRER